MSSHHSEQMSQRSQVSRIAHRRCSQNVLVFVFVIVLVFVFVFVNFFGHVMSCHGPRVVQHDIQSCNIPMGSVLRSFGAFQGNIWSVAPFIPGGPGENDKKRGENHFFPCASSLWSNVSKRSQVSRFTLYYRVCSVVKTLIVSGVRQTEQASKGQGHLLSCSGQLKTIPSSHHGIGHTCLDDTLSRLSKLPGCHNVVCNYSCLLYTSDAADE